MIQDLSNTSNFSKKRNFKICPLFIETNIHALEKISGGFSLFDLHDFGDYEPLESLLRLMRGCEEVDLELLRRLLKVCKYFFAFFW